MGHQLRVWFALALVAGCSSTAGGRDDNSAQNDAAVIGTTVVLGTGGSSVCIEAAASNPIDFARVGCGAETNLDCQLACFTSVCGAEVHGLTPEQVASAARNFLCQAVVDHSVCNAIPIPADCGGYAGTGGATSTGGASSVLATGGASTGGASAVAGASSCPTVTDLETGRSKFGACVVVGAPTETLAGRVYVQFRYTLGTVPKMAMLSCPSAPTLTPQDACCAYPAGTITNQSGASVAAYSCSR
jgi:hypothetical protein